MEHKNHILFGDVDPSLCMGLKMRRLNRIITKIFNDALRPYGVNISQLNILFTIGYGMEVHQSQIGEVLVLERSTLSRDLKRMAEKGLIQSKKIESVKSPVLKLTDEGQRFVKELVPVWRNAQEQVEKIVGENGLDAIDEIELNLFIL